MCAKSFESQLHQAPMKPGARPTSEHRPDQRTRKTECPQPARHVDPIGSSEWLEERAIPTSRLDRRDARAEDIRSSSSVDPVGARSLAERRVSLAPGAVDSRKISHTS